MNIYYFILRRLLLVNKFSLRSVINISIILSVLVSSLTIPITLSISNGFKSNIEKKIINFDGYARILKNDLNHTQYNYLLTNRNLNIIPFYEEESIIRYSNISEGVTHIQVKKNNYLNEFLIEESNNATKGIYIGSQLNKKLFSDNESLGNSIFIINPSNKIEKREVIGIFETEIPLYDKHVVIELNQNIEEEGYILNKKEFLTINKEIYIKMDTYKDRYYDFIKWLDSYNLPINLLLLFILVISLLNNTFCFRIDIINRSNDIEVFQTLGFDKHDLINLFWRKYLILNLIGIILGTSISLCLLILEQEYNFIKLPKDVYFSSSLPILINVNSFLIIPIFLLLDVIYKRFTLRKYFNEN